MLSDMAVSASETARSVDRRENVARVELYLRFRELSRPESVNRATVPISKAASWLTWLRTPTHSFSPNVLSSFCLSSSCRVAAKQADTPSYRVSLFSLLNVDVVPRLAPRVVEASPRALLPSIPEDLTSTPFLYFFFSLSLKYSP